MGAFFAKYGEVNEVSAVLSKSGIGTGDIFLQITLNRQNFGEIPNILMCHEKRMLAVVEGRRPYSWSYGASGHMSKACPSKKATPQPQATAVTTPSVAAAETATKTPTMNGRKLGGARR